MCLIRYCGDSTAELWYSPSAPCLSCVFDVQLDLHKWHFKGDVTDGSTAGGSRPPSMSTSGIEMGTSMVESAPRKGGGTRQGGRGYEEYTRAK